MKLADSNVWLALALTGHEHHESVLAWFGSQSPQNEIAFCRLTQLTLVRLLTTRAVLKPYGLSPLSNDEGWKFYSQLLADRRVQFVDEPEGFESDWQRLASMPSASPKLWMDAYLASFAIAGDTQLVTFDKAFRQFQGLDLELLA